MHLVVFESSHWADLAPFTLTRPACLLRCGATTLLEKHWQNVGRQLRLRLTLWVREPLVDSVRRAAVALYGPHVAINAPLDDEPALLVDGASLRRRGNLLPKEALTDLGVMFDDTVMTAARTVSPGLSASDALQNTPRWQALADLPRFESRLKSLRHWGDLIDQNALAIVEDASLSTLPTRVAASTRIKPWDVRGHETAEVSPGVVLDASKGPILLDHDCYIGANSVIEGPCYVGPHSRITPLSLIRAGTSIGPVCRVGGEVSNTIFQAYSNKSHDGFIGDSYVGAWVNCGAGTTTSNLKSTYGPVSVTLGGRKIPTDRATLGAAIGDHAKLATYARLAAGGYVGVASVVSLSDRMPAFTPSFRFIDDRGDEPLDPAKAEEITQRMMSRRDVALSDEDRALFAYARKAAQEIER